MAKVVTKTKTILESQYVYNFVQTNYLMTKIKQMEINGNILQSSRKYKNVFVREEYMYFNLPSQQFERGDFTRLN